MAQRHDDALFIQAGACNPQGVSKSLAASYDEAAKERRLAGTMSTDAVSKDPACQLILHQLCHLAGIWTSDHTVELAQQGKAFNWDVAVEHCKLHASAHVVDMWQGRYGIPAATPPTPETAPA